MANEIKPHPTLKYTTKVAMNNAEREQQKDDITRRVAGGSPNESFINYQALIGKYPQDTAPTEGYRGVKLVRGFTNTAGDNVAHAYFYNVNQKWEDNGVYQADGINPDDPVIQNINNKINDFPIDILQTKNIFNPNNVVKDKYIDYSTGRIETAAGFCYSDFIEVNTNKVAISKLRGLAIGSIHCCYYDENKNYIGGVLATTNIPVITPIPNTKYLIVSVGYSDRGNYQVELNENVTSFMYYEHFEILKNQKIIDYNLKSKDTFRIELETIGSIATSNHWFNFNIPNDTYNIKSYFTEDEILTPVFWGLFVPDNVFIVGKDRQKTILSFEMPITNQYTSTLNFAGTCGIKNLTVEGIRTRYAIHDDFADEAHTNYIDHYYRIVENCIIKSTETYYGNYGSGCRSGAIWNFKNVLFEGGMSWHTNINFTLPAELNLENCVFYTKGNNGGLILKSLDSKANNVINIIGCSTSKITIWKETENIPIDFQIYGHGNNDMLIDYPDMNHPIPELSDQIITLKANNDMVVGSAVYRSGNLAVLLYNDFPKYRFYGISLENKKAGECVKVLIKGLYKANESGYGAKANNTLLTPYQGLLTDTSGVDHVVAVIEDNFIRLLV